jgi:hypothetical protein
MSQFEPDLTLEPQERALLAQLTVNPGYKIFHRICRSEVDKFIVQLINSDAAKTDEVLATHTMAKAAAMFYQGVTARINEEVLLYTGAPRESDKPVDITEGLLDLDEMRRINNMTGLREEMDYE